MSLHVNVDVPRLQLKIGDTVMFRNKQTAKVIAHNRFKAARGVICLVCNDQSYLGGAYGPGYDVIGVVDSKFQKHKEAPLAV